MVLCITYCIFLFILFFNNAYGGIRCHTQYLRDEQFPCTQYLKGILHAGTLQLGNEMFPISPQPHY